MFPLNLNQLRIQGHLNINLTPPGGQKNFGLNRFYTVQAQSQKTTTRYENKFLQTSKPVGKWVVLISKEIYSSLK